MGSGQSAAEIFYDLLNYSDHFEKLSWFTRSQRFYPMEYSKLTLEMTSAGYVDHFFSLSATQKIKTLRAQDPLYKGINFSLINEIYDALYLKELDGSSSNIELRTCCELKGIVKEANELRLQFHHGELQKEFEHSSNAVILATGYKAVLPAFVDSIKEQVCFTEDGCYQVNRNYSVDASGKRVFVQNADLHSHGFTAPDLGMGPYRNATILNAILGYEHFVMERKVAFQNFGVNT